MAKRKIKNTPVAVVETGQVTAPTGNLPVINTKSIGAFSQELLGKVVGENEDKQPVGLPYAEVLEQVKARFPDGHTSLKSLAWYNSDMKKKGIKVPLRPRATKVIPAKIEATPAKAKVETPEAPAKVEASEAPAKTELVPA